MKRFMCSCALAALTLGPLACEADAPVNPAPVDARLSTYDVQIVAPTEEGLAYLRAVSAVHAKADEATSDDARVAVLRDGVDLTAPSEQGPVAVVRLELLARWSEARMQQTGGAEEVLDVLEPALDPAVALPRDRSAARVLVDLGDAAYQVDEPSLAVGSYLRAIDLMTELPEQLQEESP